MQIRSKGVRMSAMIYEAWPVILSAMFFMIWLIRLESKVLYLERDRNEHWNKIDAMQTKLQEIAEALARLEGKLETKHNENRS